MLMAITRPRKLLYTMHDPFPEAEDFELQTCQTDRTPAQLMPACKCQLVKKKTSNWDASLGRWWSNILPNQESLVYHVVHLSNRAPQTDVHLPPAVSTASFSSGTNFNTSVTAFIIFRRQNVFGIFQSECFLTVPRHIDPIYRTPLPDCTFSCWHSFLAMDFKFPWNTTQ